LLQVLRFRKEKIKLFGILDKKSRDFILYHWYLKSPFTIRIVKNIVVVPHEVETRMKDSLDADDFERKLKVRPSVFNKVKKTY